MRFILIGLAALLLWQFVLKGFLKANPAQLARVVRMIVGGASLIGAVFLGVRGGMIFAVPLGAFGVNLLLGRPLPFFGPSFGGARPADGQTSRIVTETLEMELDIGSGAIAGRVRRGAFAGQALEGLSPSQLARLWRECRFNDPKAAKLLEAYLDRAHPGWQDDAAREEGTAPATGTGTMTRDEAFAVLGLASGANDDEVRQAHHELMKKLHPDRGGSDYLAAKINAAKDVLVGK